MHDEKSNTGPGSGEGGTEQPETMSLLGGVGGGGDDLEDLEDESSGPRFGGLDLKNSGVLLFLVVAVVAGGAIYLMRASQSELSTGEDSYQQIEGQIDQALAQLQQLDRGDDVSLEQGALGGAFGDTEAMVSSLVVDLTEKQVPLEYVQKNPFVSTLEAEDAQRERQEPGVSPEQARQQQVDERRQQVERLRLQTVSSGARGAIAIISGQMVREGAQVEGFTVRSIDANQMTVELEDTELGERFLLTMQGAR